MSASQIRKMAAVEAGSPLRNPTTGNPAWARIREIMRAAGCVPSKRDVSGKFQSSAMRWGWLAQDGSWTPCDGARQGLTPLAHAPYGHHAF